MSKTTEQHDDGSRTDRYSNGQSVTYNPDDTVRESTKVEDVGALSGIPVFDLLTDEPATVTRDGDGHIINVQK